ncbi:MAG: hypothetical protein S4CHLAM37_16960 [Chlamydiia bacterium]|nr:hypothetical protein [Chlamydiia bacterium]
MKKYILAALLLVSTVGGFSSITYTYDQKFLKSKNEDPNLLMFCGGAYNFTRSNSKHKTGALQLEFKGPSFFGKKILKIKPFAALLGTFQGSLWLGAGVNFDINFSDWFVATLGFGPGLFYKGGGKDLGYPLEMRSSAEVAYRFKSKARFGVQFYHLSNASLARRNPGTEVLLLFYAIPI